MEHAHDSYIPAAGHDWLLRFYDPLVRWLGVDRVRVELVARAALAPGQRVLDVGCGTGTLAVLAKRLHPGVDVVGLDPDPNALARARRKAERAGLSVRFERGVANALPYADASFARVFSTLMFHHLDADTKAASLREMRRVLAPGGALHLLDFAPQTGNAGGAIARRLPWNHRSQDLFEERVVALLRDAGFAGATRLPDCAVLLGRVAHFTARAP